MCMQEHKIRLRLVTTMVSTGVLHIWSCSRASCHAPEAYIIMSKDVPSPRGACETVRAVQSVAELKRALQAACDMRTLQLH